jgi:hypothetical protein
MGENFRAVSVETRRSGQWPAADRAYLRREWLDFLRARGLLVPGVDAGEG